MARREDFRIDVEPVVAHHHDGGHFLALFARQSMIRHRRQPDVGVEPDLVAGVAGQRRTAARLPDVADQYAGPAGVLVRLDRQPLQQRDHVGMSPIAVARQPHHLPGVAVDRHLLARRRCSPWHRSRSRAVGIAAGSSLRANNCLAPSLGSLGLVQRRQRLRIDAALVLRRRGAGAEQDGCEAEAGSEVRRDVIGSLYSPRKRSMKEGSPRQSQLLDPQGVTTGRIRIGREALSQQPFTSLGRRRHHTARKEFGQGIIVKRVTGAARASGRLDRRGVGGGAGARRCRGPDRQIVPAHGRERGRRDALQLAGLDRPRRLWHAERHLPSAVDDAELFLAQVLQRADAARDLLLLRFRHPRHQ